MELSLVIIAFIFITGLVVGSFLNVVILRTVSGESIVFPGSKCPKCQHPLKWYHNIPVLSYIFLKGKCGFCHEPISIQYPIVELFTGLVFVGLLFRFCMPIDPLFGLSVINPIGWDQLIIYVFSLIVSCLFIILAGTDILEQKVADIHTYSLIGVGILYSVIMAAFQFVIYCQNFGIPKIDLNFFITSPVFYSIAAAALGFLIMEIVARLGILLVGTRTFGEGDSYIAAGLGAVFGGFIYDARVYSGFLPIAKAVCEILILAVIIQLILTIPVFIKKLINNKDWFTLGSVSAFIIYSAGYTYAQSAGWFSNNIAMWCSTIILLIIGIMACKELLFGIKEHRENGMYLPFGPAMVAAGFVALFFGLLI